MSQRVGDRRLFGVTEQSMREGPSELLEEKVPIRLPLLQTKAVEMSRE